MFAPARKDIELDISKPVAFYYGKNAEDGYNVSLVHWSNYRTKLALYKFEVQKLNKMQKQKSGVLNKLLYQYKAVYYVYCINNICVYAQRVVNKIRKILKAEITNI